MTNGTFAVQCAELDQRAVFAHYFTKMRCAFGVVFCRIGAFGGWWYRGVDVNSACQQSVNKGKSLRITQKSTPES
jgi:hypothetical protein